MYQFFGKIWCSHVAGPLILEGDLKMSDQNNWGGPKPKLNFGGELNLKEPKILGGLAMNPNDVIMVVVLKDILLCLLGFRLIYIVYISLYCI